MSAKSPPTVPLVPDWLFEGAIADMEPTRALVLLALWNYRGQRPPWIVFPRRETIMQRAGVSRNTLDKCYTELERAGYLKRHTVWDKEAGKKRTQIELIPQTITPTAGVILQPTITPASEQTYAQPLGPTYPHPLGHRSYPDKLSKEVCGAAPPDSHTISLWISEAQGMHPKIDCEAVWKMYSAAKAGRENKGIFLRWCANEKNLFRKAPRPQQNDQGPEGWREALEEMHPGNMVNAENQPWSLLPPTKQQEVAKALRSA